MEFAFKVATLPVAAVMVSLIYICAIARVVVRVSNSTSILQGYELEVIALVAYTGIAALPK